MTIEVGDLIEITNPDNLYFGGTFTVTRINYPVPERPVYTCLRSSMVISRHFNYDEVKKIESSSHFPLGTTVVLTRSVLGASKGSLVIIETSNRIASLVRAWSEYAQEHRTRYVSNRNLRILK